MLIKWVHLRVLWPYLIRTPTRKSQSIVSPKLNDIKIIFTKVYHYENITQINGLSQAPVWNTCPEKIRRPFHQLLGYPKWTCWPQHPPHFQSGEVEPLGCSFQSNYQTHCTVSEKQVEFSSTNQALVIDVCYLVIRFDTSNEIAKQNDCKNSQIWIHCYQFVWRFGLFDTPFRRTLSCANWINRDTWHNCGFPRGQLLTPPKL